MLLDITQMKPGESGIVKEIQGGCGLSHRVQDLGLRPGKKITKVSSHFLRGPQTVNIGNVRVAIGFGMAKKILVETKSG